MRELPAERLRELLKYDPVTGLFFWIKAPVNHPRLQAYAAGCITTGYVMIKIDSHKYKAHRLAWLYAYGEWPSGDIDHINGCPLDNRLSNLRIATNPQNQANRRRDAGKSLPKGVRALKSGRFQARINFENRQIMLGTFPSIQEAAEAYLKAAQTYYGEFARAA